MHLSFFLSGFSHLSSIYHKVLNNPSFRKGIRNEGKLRFCMEYDTNCRCCPCFTVILGLITQIWDILKLLLFERSGVRRNFETLPNWRRKQWTVDKKAFLRTNPWAMLNVVWFYNIPSVCWKCKQKREQYSAFNLALYINSWQQVSIPFTWSEGRWVILISIRGSGAELHRHTLTKWIFGIFFYGNMLYFLYLVDLSVLDFFL